MTAESARPAALPGMVIGVSLQHPPMAAARRSGLRRFLGLILVLVSPAMYAAPRQTGAGKNHTHSSAQASARFLEAENLLQQGKLDEAKASVQAELERDPANVEGYNLLGIICSDQKDFAGAQDAFEHALKIDPRSARTHNNLGNVFVAEQKLPLAENEFQTVLRLDPVNRDANYNLALLLMAKGQPAGAISHLERVHPANLPTRFNLIHAYLQAGRTAEALKMARALSAEHKDDVQLHFTLGVMLASERQYPAAQFELEKANALQPETFDILYNLGQAYLRGNEKTKAELILNRALKLQPDSPEGLYLLAQVYSEERRAVDALDLLVRAHKLAPQNTDVIFLMARVSMTQNYFEDAIPLLQSGIKIAPQRPDLHAALGESYFMSGKTELAVQEFQTLIQLDPSARSYAFMGLSYRHLGRFDEAKKYFQKGLDLDPRNTSCLFNMGYIEERQGNAAGAEALFQKTLRENPDFAEALLELANLRIASRKFAEAADLLRKYVKVSREPSSGYYKLAMVERSLHQTQAAARDLSVFQTLSKDAATGPYPYEHLFDYLDNRAKLAPRARAQEDLTQLTEQIQKHPDQPENLYLLAEAYLKLGKLDQARQAIAQLDQLSSGDYRTQAGIGVLLARYRLYDDAIQHFQSALTANPTSDAVKFDLTDAYFRKGMYDQALETAQTVSPQGRDDTFLALLGDIYAHLGDSDRASEIFRDAIARNPDNDQYYLSLTLVQLRTHDVRAAEQTLLQGQARIPGSGKILWGMGLVSVLEGKTREAAEQFERAVNLLPEWSGSYSTLGVFYYQTGQIAKAREVLARFKNSNTGGLDVGRIEEVLAKAPTTEPVNLGPMPMAARQQLLQLALLLADRTL
jgi:tetratricopeptide (TPR) repeat protein